MRRPTTMRTRGWLSRRPTAASTSALTASNQCTSSTMSRTGWFCPATASRLTTAAASGSTATAESGSAEDRRKNRTVYIV